MDIWRNYTKMHEGHHSSSSYK